MGILPRLALLALLSAIPVAMPRPARAARAPGIDVSKWQETIDWPAVSAGETRFAIIRATRGNHYVDEQYLINKAGAEAEGIRVGAYHYAKPKGGRNDAIDEANHFVDHAALGPGNLIPALDLEQAGGLSPRRLQRWAAAWLNRVRNRIGVKPMIYTSPSFWERAMDDAQRFARRGYKLWIAHWFVRRPDVPAAHWAHRGWTFWQWTDCGRVNGIAGCVDKDRYEGKNLGKVEIP